MSVPELLILAWEVLAQQGFGNGSLLQVAEQRLECGLQLWGRPVVSDPVAIAVVPEEPLRSTPIPVADRPALEGGLPGDALRGPPEVSRFEREEQRTRCKRDSYVDISADCRRKR